MPGRLVLLGVALAALTLLPPAAVAAAPEFDLQAHRGGRGETTESLRAFAASLELGVSTLELDVVITKDGQPWSGTTQRSTPASAPTPRPS